MICDQLVQKCPAQFDIRCHFHNLKLGILEFGKRFSKGFPLLAILDGDFQHIFGGGHRADAAHDPLLLELQHEIDEPRSLGAQTVRNRNPAVGKIELGRVLAVPAYFLEFSPLFETGRSGLYQIEIHSPVRIVHRRIPGGQNQQVAVDAVADKGLLPIDDHLIALLDCRGLDRRQVTARIRFRHGDSGNDIAGDAARQVFLLMFFGAEGDDIGHHHVAVKRCRQSAMIGLDHFLGHDDRIEKIAARPTVFLGNGGAQKSLFSHLLPGAPGDDARFLPFLHMGDDLPFQEFS